MCEFTWPRLEYYIRKIGESDVNELERLVLLYLEDKFQEGWKHAIPLINKCKLYQKAKSSFTDPTNQASSLLATYAQLAGQVRQHREFRDLTDEVDTSSSDKGIKLSGLAQIVKWINYLGRVYTAYTSFIKFCTNESQRRYSFEYRILESQDDDLFGNTYIQKIQSWTGDLGLTDELELRRIVNGIKVTEHKTVETLMAEVVKAAGNKARVHFEMQLLIYFSQPGVEKCLDYFGCSKKSCSLCWQMILQNSKYSMKNTHRKLYPRWAFPFDFSSAEPTITEGLRVSYVEMLSLIQNKVVKGIPLRSLEPYLQTSARITRRTSTAKETDQDLEARLFSFNPIAAPDRFHSVSLPALHLPAGEPPGKLRQVQVYGYPLNSKFRVLPTILNGKAYALAFQLLSHSSGFEERYKGLEHQNHFWTVEDSMSRSKKIKWDG